MSDRRPSRRHELVASIGQGAMLLTEDGEVVAINVAAEELLGLGRPAGTKPAGTKPTGTSRNLTSAALSSPALIDAVAAVWRTGEPGIVDAVVGDRHLRASASLVRDEVLLLLSDRTQERRVEELRRDFVVNASHELKTPVTSIQTLADALTVVVHDRPDRVPALVARLRDESERLAALVHDLLDLRRLEERGSAEHDRVDLAEVLRQVAAAQFGRAEAAGVELSVEAPDHLVLLGAEGDLRVMVQNLLANAITYHRAGGEVRLRLHETGGGARSRDRGVTAGEVVPTDRLAELTIADTGIGIPPADLPRVFERFYRVDTGRSRATGGTGLGLAIVRHAVEQAGGAIHLDSEPDHGTTVTVRLPVRTR